MSSEASNWLRDSITAKSLMIALLILIMLIPTSMIRRLINEREITRDDVVNEISTKWGRQQTLAGPVISIPYKAHYKRGDEIIERIGYAHFLPDTLQIDGNISPEIRSRGIYNIIAYNSLLHFHASFDQIDFSGLQIKPEDVLWNENYVSIGITDMKGINEPIRIRANDQALSVTPGTPLTDIVESGVNARVHRLEENKRLEINFDLDFKGSEMLSFIPLGEKNEINISSSWGHPSFNGEFLPDKRKIDENGFTAHWNILNLNRNYPQEWANDDYDITRSAFGVRLLFPVDQYQMSYRSVKYAIMFLGLTFLVFFFSEILNKKRIHPIQYLLVGFALCLFYTLLVSLSEHVNFLVSYLVAAVSTILLITAYTSSFLKSARLTGIVALVLVVLYSFLYTILQLQDYSLLFGSIGLFVTLAIVMYLSRNIEWNSSIKEPEGNPDKLSEP